MLWGVHQEGEVPFISLGTLPSGHSARPVLHGAKQRNATTLMWVAAHQGSELWSELPLALWGTTEAKGNPLLAP